jgi:hypothetical protein
MGSQRLTAWIMARPSPFHRKMYIRLLVRCHLRPIWPSVLPLNLTYFEISSATALSEPALYKLLTFQVPNLISIFCRLGRLSKESIQARGFLRSFGKSLFICGELLTLGPTPQLEDHPLSAVRDCLFNIFAATLHPKPEDAPCRGDKGPTGLGGYVYLHELHLTFHSNTF